MVRPDDGTFADDHGRLDDVQEFAHVAGPRMGAEHGQRFVAEAALDAETRAEQFSEVAGEQGDVLAAVPQ